MVVEVVARGVRKREPEEEQSELVRAAKKKFNIVTRLRNTHVACNGILMVGVELKGAVCRRRL